MSPRSLPFTLTVTAALSPGAGCGPSVGVFGASEICVGLEQAFKLIAFWMTNPLQSEEDLNRRDHVITGFSTPAMSRLHRQSWGSF